MRPLRGKYNKNRPIIRQPHNPRIRYIALPHGLKVAVDADDYEFLNERHWYASHSPSGFITVMRIESQARIPGRRTVGLLMARVIMRAKNGEMVRLKNLNGLDLRKSNLILVHKSRGRSRAKYSRNTSGFKGVSFQKDCNLFTARSGGVYVGAFKTAREAAHAHDKVAKKQYGSLAVLNFPSK